MKDVGRILKQARHGKVSPAARRLTRGLMLPICIGGNTLRQILHFFRIVFEAGKKNTAASFMAELPWNASLPDTLSRKAREERSSGRNENERN